MGKFYIKLIISVFIFVNLFFYSASAIDEESANYSVYKENNKFGLMKNEEKITEPVYLKLIKLKDKSYIFMYKNKFGIISIEGDILVEPKYTSASRFVGKYAKLGLGGKYVLYNESADKILDDNYADIAILYGKMFLVKKNYKYGLTSFEGDILLAPIADDIYMPKANVLMISYGGEWYEIVQTSKDVIQLPSEFESLELNQNKDFTITKIVENPVASAGYGVVSASDYFIKIFSSISPAYEETIDELILSHGADTANILIKSAWFVKFPFVYVKNYAVNLKTPNNGPLSEVKSNLKNKIN